MKAKRTISNREFEEARTPEVRLLLTNLTRHYSNALSSDVLQAVGDMALWRCLQNHDPKYGSNFNTSLYRFVHWECLRAIGEQRPSGMAILGEVEIPGESMSIHMILDDYLGLLDTRDRRIIEARFLENCTFAEIAQREGFSKQGIKDIVDRSISTMSEAAQAV